MPDTRITVTGGKGFLGRHLLQAFAAHGYGRVQVADLPEYDLLRLADVQRLYAEQLRLARSSDEYRLRLILSRTKPEADAVVGILAQGAGFEAVATERSIDEATRFSGGDLGCVIRLVVMTTAADKGGGSFHGQLQTRPRVAAVRRL